MGRGPKSQICENCSVLFKTYKLMDGISSQGDTEELKKKKKKKKKERKKCV